LDLPTLAEVEADRVGKPIPKGPSRLERRTAESKADRRLAQAFRQAVWARDGGRCRQCGGKVVRSLRRQANRGEVHHLHGRGVLALEVRCAVLVCAGCHEKLTGRMNERWRVVGTQFIAGIDHALIDATYPVAFERIA